MLGGLGVFEGQFRPSAIGFELRPIANVCRGAVNAKGVTRSVAHQASLPPHPAHLPIGTNNPVGPVCFIPLQQEDHILQNQRPVFGINTVQPQVGIGQKGGDWVPVEYLSRCIGIGRLQGDRVNRPHHAL